MLGAFAGDIIGSPYEFDDYNYKNTDFPLFSENSAFTDDSVMTAAVAQAMIDGYGDEAKTEQLVITEMQRFGRMFPGAGYGGRFIDWLSFPNPKPYGSFGNGSAMRVSSVGWLYDTLEDVLKYAEISARVTHNHPEGIKGAQATAAAIFLAREGKSVKEICDYVEKQFGYPLSSMSCDAIRPGYSMDESCQGSIPQAFCAFREGKDFENVVRLAVSLGGDSDTIAAIAGSIAEAMYGIPENIEKQVIERLDMQLLEVYFKFLEKIDS